MPFVLVYLYSFSPTWSVFNIRSVINISSLSHSFISGSLNFLHGSFHIPLALKVWLYPGTVWWYMPLLPRTIECWIFLINIVMLLFLYSLSLHTLSQELFFLSFPLYFGSSIRLDSTYIAAVVVFGYWSFHKENWDTNHIISMPYFYCPLNFINRNAIHLSNA